MISHFQFLTGKLYEIILMWHVIITKSLLVHYGDVLVFIFVLVFIIQHRFTYNMHSDRRHLTHPTRNNGTIIYRHSFS